MHPRTRLLSMWRQSAQRSVLPHHPLTSSSSLPPSSLMPGSASSYPTTFLIPSPTFLTAFVMVLTSASTPFHHILTFQIITLLLINTHTKLKPTSTPNCPTAVTPAHSPHL